MLHDVIGKSDDWTIERLRLEGFSDAILKVVDALTRRDGEDYSDLIQRALADKIARTREFSARKKPREVWGSPSKIAPHWPRGVT